MNKFVLGALALTAASTPSFAGTDNWSVVDSDIATIAQGVAKAPSGATVSGFLRSSYADSGDFTTASGNDLGGFAIDNARINFTGGIANFSLVIEADAVANGGASPIVFGQTDSASTFGVLDAYAGWAVTEELKVQMGQFRPPFLASSHISDQNLLFIDRTLLGNDWYFRDQGLQVGGDWGMLSFDLAVMNGMDQAGDDLAFTGRVQLNLMGQPSAYEGSLGATGDPCLSLGFGYWQDDGSVDDVIAMGLDASFTMGIFNVAAEMVDYDKGMGLVVPAGTVSDATPWNAQVGVMAIPDQLEVALRYEDLDDSDDTQVMTIGANWYMQGHAAKWQLNYSTSDSDAVSQDGDVIAVGLTVGI